MTDPRASEPRPVEAGEGFDRAHALALLLPALAVAWPGPGALVARDPIATELTAAGVAALACAPAALVLAWRALRGARFSAGYSLLLAPLVLVALLSSLARPGGDPLERARALLALAGALVLALGGAQLGTAGRATLVRGSVAVALLFLAPALVDRAAGFGGVLQNTGELSNAALGGALAGAGLFAAGRGPWKHVGLVALASFLIHAFAAPVLAGLVALGFAAAVAASRRWSRAPERDASPAEFRAPVQIQGGRWSRVPERDASQRLFVAAAACLAGLAWIALGRPLGDWSERDEAPAPIARASNELGGVEVRQLVARSSLALFADHALLGVGPGQFAVEFPPYRDEREIELSSPGRASGIETEVEHPHDDHLAFLVEEGVAGALAWLAFACAVAFAALRKARAGSSDELALAAGSLGLLAAAAANAPFTANAAASSLAFAFFGATLGAGARTESKRALRLAAAALGVAFVLLCARPATRLVRHGFALASLPAGEPARATDLRRAIDAALEAAPDSVVAWTLRARQLEATGAPSGEVRAAWQRVLELRPHRLEALVQLGVQHARAGEVEEARALFAAAAELDPRHPGVLKNRVRLELVEGDAENGSALLLELDARHGRDALWLRDLGAELLCRGLDREAQQPLALADPRFAELDAAEAMEISRAYRAAGSALAADGFDVQANRLWAREHAATGHWDDARRMLRQAIRISRDTVLGGGTRLRMELAAAMWRSDRPEEARQELEDLALRPADWESVEEWTREALREMGFVPPL